MYLFRAWRVGLCTALGLFTGLAQLAAQPHHATADLPPLVDRAHFFGHPERTGAQLSPDGQYIAFLQPHQDVLNVHVIHRTQTPDSARVLTRHATPITAFSWNGSARYLLYTQPVAGTAPAHLFALDLHAGSADAPAPRPARNLTPLPGITALLYAMPAQAPASAIVGLNARDSTVHDVYRIDLATGRRTLLVENTQRFQDFVIDATGAVRLGITRSATGTTEFYALSDNSTGPVLTCNNTEACRPLRFHMDGQRLYLAAAKGTADLAGLMLLDVQTGALELVETDPLGEVDWGGAWFDSASGELLATYYDGTRRLVYPKQKPIRRDFRILDRQIPFGQQWVTSSTTDMRYHLVEGIQDKDPGTVYLYDRKEGTVEQVYKSRPALRADVLCSMLKINYPARDGTPIPAFLTLPKGRAAIDLPLVVLPHGGARSRTTWGYDPWVQFLANRGYAVLQPNYRGSAGYGKRFMEAGTSPQGIDVMHLDIADGVQYLISEGLVDAARVAIVGGYPALAGLTTMPALYAAGVALQAQEHVKVSGLSMQQVKAPFLAVHANPGATVPKPAYHIAQAAAVERFLAAHLGGTWQPLDPAAAETLSTMQVSVRNSPVKDFSHTDKQNP